MSIQTNKRMIFGDINSKLQHIIENLISLDPREMHGKNIVFVCRNVAESRSLQASAARILSNHDIFCRYAAVAKLDTGWWGILHFVPISQANCKLRGLSMHSAYLDISQQQLDANEQTITNIHIQTLFSNNEWNETHESEINEKNGKPNTFNYCWSGFGRWIRKRWKDTVEMFG